MGRHIIINIQSGDQTITTTVESLRTKPIKNKQWVRESFDWERLPEIGELGDEDKVYLVGHGGSGETAGKLGGWKPTELAARVTTPLMKVGQINLVMCGSGDPTLSGAKVFKDILEMFQCSAKVYAYNADLKVINDPLSPDQGKKYADFGGVKGVLVPGREVKKEVKLDESPQGAAEDDGDTILDD